MRLNISLNKPWLPWLLLAVLLALLLAQVRWLRAPENLIGRNVYWRQDNSLYGQVISIEDSGVAQGYANAIIRLDKPQPIEKRKRYYRSDKSVYYKTIVVGLKTTSSMGLYEIGIGRYGPNYQGDSSRRYGVYATIPATAGLLLLSVCLTVGWLWRETARTRQITNCWEAFQSNTALQLALWVYFSHGIAGLAAGLFCGLVFVFILVAALVAFGVQDTEKLIIALPFYKASVDSFSLAILGFLAFTACGILGALLLATLSPMEWLKRRKVAANLFLLVLALILFGIPSIGFTGLMLGPGFLP